MRAASLLSLCFLACVQPDYGGSGLRGTFDGPLGPDARVALIWNNWNNGQRAEARYATVVEGTRTSGGFSIDITDPPPDAAMEPLGYFEPQGRSGRISLGVLVAYSDLNHNGMLDTTPADTDPIDRIEGVSSEYFSGQGTSVGYEIRYVEGDPPDSAPGLKPGYNLLHDGQVLESLTGATIGVRPSKVHSLYVCEPITYMLIPQVWDRCLGPGPTRVYAFLDRMFDRDDVWVELYDNGVPHSAVEVSVNGHPLTYDPAAFAHSANEAAGVLLGAGQLNNVVVREQDGSELRREVQMPPAFTITNPVGATAIRWSDPLVVSWSPAAADSTYLARESVRFADAYHTRSERIVGGSEKTFAPLVADPGADLPANVVVYTFEQPRNDEGDEVSTLIYQRATFTITR